MITKQQNYFHFYSQSPNSRLLFHHYLDMENKTSQSWKKKLRAKYESWWAQILHALSYKFRKSEVRNQHSYCQGLRKSACNYGRLDVKMNRYCLSNFLLQIAGCYLIVGGGEGEIKWIKAHSLRLHCHQSLLLSGKWILSLELKSFWDAIAIAQVWRWEEKIFSSFPHKFISVIKKSGHPILFPPKVLKNQEVWSKLWNVVKIVKSGQNCKVWPYCNISLKISIINII